MNKREITKFRKSYVPWTYERLKLSSEVTLAISFDEKDEIRSRFNARWDPDEKVWWIKTGFLSLSDLEYLNDLKALYCPRAIVYVEAVEKAIIDVESIGHKIYCANTGHRRVFDHYPSIQITRIALSPDSDHPATMWVDEQAARYLWKTYMDEGYRRCYNTTTTPSAQEIDQIR